MMKKSLFSAATIALALTAGSAFAADLPSYKAPPVYIPPPPMWTGFYIGLNAGGTFGGSNSVTSTAFPAIPNPAATTVYTVNGATGPLGTNLLSSSVAALSATGVSPGSSNGGFIGGGQIGYNWQFMNSFVAGVEADIQGVASGRSTVNGFGAATDPSVPFGPVFSPFVTFQQVHKSLDYLGTVRGRLGYLVTPSLLAYATGGLAYGGVNLSASYFTANLCPGVPIPAPASTLLGPGFGTPSFSDTRVGWTFGGGGEWLFAPKWSAKVEYLYYNLGSVTTPTTIVAGFTNGGTLSWAYAANARTRFNGHIVRAGLNYHFNWGQPL
jgi:outer membrane immunogenic protein